MEKYSAFTQTDCKNIWESIKNCHPTIDEINNIDKATPWSETEPTWWLEMMDVRHKLQQEQK